MNLKQWITSHRGQLQLTKLQTYLNIGLTGAVLLLTIMAFDVKDRVILQPYTLTSDAWVMGDEASQSYQEAWGLFLAQMMGNVTPQNASFIIERIKPLLSPKIYNSVVQQLESQVESVIADSIVTRFEPSEVGFETSTGKVFVSGKVFSGGAGQSTAQAVFRTFEFKIRISNYIPIIDDMNFYDGKAQTQSELKRVNSKEKQMKKKEASR